jgi:hypothetical protein
MKRNLLGCLLAIGSLIAATPATADLCTIEATPAATLLLPYFEVDITDTNGVDTFFSINNASDESVMTHVILWTDLSVEALDFNVYLTGYDVQTIGLGLIIRDGILPVTGDANQYSNRGAFSELHPGEQDEVDGYPGCAAIDFPYAEPELSAEFLEQHLQPILTGGPSAIYSGRCGGLDHGDEIARGYVTIDATKDCTLLRPCDPGYFLGDPNEVVGDWRDVLWGDWYLVHLEAYLDPSAGGFDDDYLELVTGPSDFVLNTFYGRCAVGLFGLAGPIPPPATGAAYFADHRETLPTSFAVRFYQATELGTRTDLLVWRDGLYNRALGEESGFACDEGPSWFLNERQIVVFDDSENPDRPAPCPVSPCPEPDEFRFFPLEAQRVPIEQIEPTPGCGWLFLNLNQQRALEEADYVVATQAWIEVIQEADGRFSVGYPAIQLDNACDFRSIELGADSAEADYPTVDGAFTPQGPDACLVDPDGTCVVDGPEWFPLGYL